MSNFATPWTAACQASLSSTIFQTHVHRVGDAIQPSHPLSSPSPPAFILSQHQGIFPMSQLFTSGGQSIGASASASVLPMNIQVIFLVKYIKKSHPAWPHTLPLNTVLPSNNQHSLCTMNKKRALRKTTNAILGRNSSYPVSTCYTGQGNKTLLTFPCEDGANAIFLSNVTAAGAGNSLQSCPTLCDPIDGSYLALNDVSPQ